MAAIDRKKIIQGAQKLVLKGKFESAAEEYEKLLAQQSKDETALNALGDVYSRLKKVPEAIKCYKKLGDIYLEKGFAVKALAVYKRVTKLDPSSIENNLRLADIQAQQGFVNEAKMQYVSVAEHCAEGGMKDKAIDVLKKVKTLDPGDHKVRLKLADLCGDRKRVEDAVREYLEVGKGMLSAGSFDGAIKVFKRGLVLDASNAKLLGALGEAYTGKGDFESAVGLFQELLKKNPKNAEVMVQLGLTYLRAKRVEEAEEILRKAHQQEPGRTGGLTELGRFYLNQGNPDQAFEVYRTAAEGLMEAGGELAEVARLMEGFTSSYSKNPHAFSLLATLYQKMGNTTHAVNAYDAQAQAHIALNEFDRAERVLQKLLEMEPDNAQHQERLRFVRSRSRKDAAPMEVGGEDLAAAQPKAVSAEAPASSQKSLDIETALASEDDMIMEFLTEADVFTKYGLIAKAIDKLQFAKTQFPRNIEVRTKLLAIYNEQGNRPKAVEECVELSKLFRDLGDDEAAEDILNDARDIDPNHPLLQGVEVAPPAEAKEKDKEEGEELDELDEAIEVEVEGLDDEEGVEELDDKEEAEGESFDTQSFEVEELAVEEAPTPQPAKREPTLDEALEEADFYLSQGFKDDALKLLKTLDEKYPAEPRVKNKLAKLVPSEAPPKPAAARKPAKAKPKAAPSAPGKKPAPPAKEAKKDVQPSIAEVMEELDALEGEGEEAGGEEFFDLAAEIQEEFTGAEGEKEQSKEELDELFSAFKQGVEKQVAKEDYETHYNLGIAYKEMGLVDEAIAEFQVAAKNPDQTRALECCSMLGVCFLDKGLPDIAAKWYRKGLDAKGLSEDDAMGLRYDLAIALEQGGNLEEAFRMYEEVYGLNTSYRDVARKIKELQRSVKGK
ncbi:MAG: tetratricopeptide repeat protein [Acidobacteriota bacterium]|nr:MAG: tetratricopeptide repeat protein [Acidobacteriota bacterium]